MDYGNAASDLMRKKSRVGDLMRNQIYIVRLLAEILRSKKAAHSPETFLKKSSYVSESAILMVISALCWILEVIPINDKSEGL